MKLAWLALGVVVGAVSTHAILTRLGSPEPTAAATPPVAATPTVAATPGVLAGACPPQPCLGVPPESLPPVLLPDGPPASQAQAGTAGPAPPPPSAGPAAPAPPSPGPAAPAPPETGSIALPILHTDLATLRARGLLIPVWGASRESLRDTFDEGRGEGSRHHQAIDIFAPRGTAVLAVDDGHVEKLFTSRLGGLTIYQFDPGGQYCYYYAHLDGYAPGLTQGMAVRRGDILGFVGTTGNAPPATPHLHFTIFRLGVERRWWEGTAINAYLIWRGPPVQ